MSRSHRRTSRINIVVFENAYTKMYIFVNFILNDCIKPFSVFVDDSGYADT